jgi:hypothetical protein
VKPWNLLFVALFLFALWIPYNICSVVMSDIIRIISIHAYHISLFLLLQKLWTLEVCRSYRPSYHSVSCADTSQIVLNSLNFVHYRSHAFCSTQCSLWPLIFSCNVLASFLSGTISADGIPVGLVHLIINCNICYIFDHYNEKRNWNVHCCLLQKYYIPQNNVVTEIML